MNMQPFSINSQLNKFPYNIRCAIGSIYGHNYACRGSLRTIYAWLKNIDYLSFLYKEDWAALTHVKAE